MNLTKAQLDKTYLQSCKELILTNEHLDPFHYPAHKISKTSKDCPLCKRKMEMAGYPDLIKEFKKITGQS